MQADEHESSDARENASKDESTNKIADTVLDKEVAIAAIFLGSFIEMWAAAVYCDK